MSPLLVLILKISAEKDIDEIKINVKVSINFIILN
jgi:hypothetical protein